MYVQSGAVIIILSFSFVVFCLLFLFAYVVVLPHYVVNKDEYNLCKYCHRSYRLLLKTRVLGLHFCCRQCGLT